MKKAIGVALAAAVLAGAGCVVTPGPYGTGLSVVPVLPSLVILDLEPFYFYQGYHYHYRDNRWYYSPQRGGPWYDLPRDRYPRETRYKGRSESDYGRGGGRSESGPGGK
jgi:hypothetical protein